MRDALAGRNYVADYVQTLTHEVKSPLSAIRGAAELLQEPMEEEQRQRFLDQYPARDPADSGNGGPHDGADRAGKSRRVLNTLEPVALRPLLEELAHACHGVAAQRNCRVTVAVSHDATVEADPFLLRRAVSNLLDNALDFSPEGGHVELGLQVKGRWAQIAVRDQGPGIPAYAQDKVFEKFYSLARPASKKKSTGLGLSFVKEIAALHKGRVELGNRPEHEGTGACAVLWLPRKTG